MEDPLNIGLFRTEFVPGIRLVQAGVALEPPELVDGQAARPSELAREFSPSRIHKS